MTALPVFIAWSAAPVVRVSFKSAAFEQALESIEEQRRVTGDLTLEVRIEALRKDAARKLSEDRPPTLIPDLNRLVDPLLRQRMRAHRVRTRLIHHVGELAVRNGENIRWAILRGMDEAFRKAGGQFDDKLDAAVAATRRVTEDSLARRRNQSVAIGPELDRLGRGKAALATAREEPAGDER